MNKYLISVFAITTLIFNACQNKFPLDRDLTKQNFTLFNQDSSAASFADIIKGRITVIGFIYTNCPDICPMTTNNMLLTEERLSKENINDVQFILLTFDPDRDTPSVLKKYAEIRGINFDNWELLWGSNETTKNLLNRFEVTAIPDDSSFTPDGELNYFMVHTDRISLIDKDGHLRNNYRGSAVNPDDLYNDIKTLGDY